MRSRRSGKSAGVVTRGLFVFFAPVFGVILMLAGLGALIAPATPATAAPPAQGWTTIQGPLPSDAGNGTTDPGVYLDSQTCPGANACVAVGWYSDDTSGQRPWGVIEQQNGTSWSVTEAPEPPNHGTGNNQGLWLGSNDCGFNLPCRAVSCPSTSFCVAVGNFENTAGNEYPVVETLSGGSWAATEPSLPSDAAGDGVSISQDSNLYSVSCSSASSCVAVGTYFNMTGRAEGLIEQLSGTTWTAITAPDPHSPSTYQNEYPPLLTGVSCASATSCVAVGSSFDSSGNQYGLVENLSGTTWTGALAAVPSNSGNAGDGHQDATLVQVACASASACQAVGVYSDTTGNQFGLIDSWNGSTWAATQAPNPGGDTVNLFAQLTAVSCPTANFCAAVGQYDDTNGKTWGLVDTLAGGTWTGAQAQLPSNSLPTSSTNFYSALTEVSCPTPGYCMAVGTYRIPTANNVFTETLSAGSWTPFAPPVPSNATQHTLDFANGRTVGCYSPVSCAVTGQMNDASNHTQAYLDTWTGAQGYWLDASDGGIFTYPNNGFYGSTGNLKLNKPMVGMAATPDAQGYWLVASDGGIFNYGDATFHGSAGNLKLNKPVVGMASTPDGAGYWLVASDGGIFNYGDAGFFGSTGNLKLNKPIVGMASTPDGLGYWLVASDGGIFSYGDATFYGSTGNLTLNKPVVGMAATPTGLGYWLVASDGGIFSYGDATFYGSTGNLTLNKPVVGMAASPAGKGYWLVASDGGIFNYGDANFQGSTGNLNLNAPVVGMAGG